MWISHGPTVKVALLVIQPSVVVWTEMCPLVAPEGTQAFTSWPLPAATQERIAYFQELLAQFRITATPEELPAMSSGYRAEIERMQKEVLDYLTRHASSFVHAKAV